MSGYVPYIPVADAGFANWIDNFADLIVANPTLYGLASTDATNIDNVRDAWNVNYDLAIGPSTRTPTTIADKDNSKAAALTVVRPYAQNIRNNAAVSDGNKIALGLTVPSLSPALIPAPPTVPLLALVMATVNTHQLSIRDSGTPDMKAKPFGAISCELQVQTLAQGAEPTENAWKPLGNSTKTPCIIDTNAYTHGQVNWYRGRWVTRGSARGSQFVQVSAWGDPIGLTVI